MTGVLSGLKVFRSPKTPVSILFGLNSHSGFGSFEEQLSEMKDLTLVLTWFWGSLGSG